MGSGFRSAATLRWGSSHPDICNHTENYLKIRVSANNSPNFLKLTHWTNLFHIYKRDSIPFSIFCHTRFLKLIFLLIFKISSWISQRKLMKCKKSRIRFQNKRDFSRTFFLSSANQAPFTCSPYSINHINERILHSGAYRGYYKDQTIWRIYPPVIL